ncbi:hypothetical protein L9F63_019998, partial [Diploptera punctata]
VRPRLIICDDSFQKVMSLCGNCRLNASDILRDCCCCRPAGAWRITKVHASLLEECAPPGDIATVDD